MIIDDAENVKSFNWSKSVQSLVMLCCHLDVVNKPGQHLSLNSIKTVALICKN